MSVITEFYSGLLDKGYTEREIRESCKRHQERVAPDWFNGTYQEYIESMHDFLNGPLRPFFSAHARQLDFFDRWRTIDKLDFFVS